MCSAGSEPKLPNAHPGLSDRTRKIKCATHQDLFALDLEAGRKFTHSLETNALVRKFRTNQTKCCLSSGECVWIFSLLPSARFTLLTKVIFEKNFHLHIHAAAGVRLPASFQEGKVALPVRIWDDDIYAILLPLTAVLMASGILGWHFVT